MDIFREALLIALGALDYSRERVKETVDKLRQQGELSKEQADKLVEELKKRGREGEEQLEKRIASAVKKARSALQFATHDDLKKIERRLSRLEKAVNELRETIAKVPKEKE